MDLLVIRHGQSEADILNVIEGRADFNLTDLGQQQATLMGEWVSKYMNIDKIFASPLKRAKQTAEKLSESVGAPVVFFDELMEWKNGLIAGLDREEANAKYPMPQPKYPHTAVYEQESDIEFRTRAETALSKIVNENSSDSKIAIISHGGMINMLFQSFLSLPMGAKIFMSSGDTAVHHWKLDDNDLSKRRIVFINSLVHLDKLPVSGVL